MGYEYGRGAEILLARTRLGFTREEMTAAMRVRPQSYQRWENGRDAIPSGIWDEVAKLQAHFDQQVERLVAEAAQVDGPHYVTVWRGASDHQPSPGLWLHIVAKAQEQAPNIVPRYPEDRD
ncbi:helix-turn-helix domain-containing protein [Nocardia farcinica]|uniref:helix-turn-helix domain-containing protein n=1 Tax=Nocardia farcinica TaxID=37329 RepID=UPI002458FD50|nr:helix-turn-helix transcriptional regulator [Nocardia farcinica]